VWKNTVDMCDRYVALTDVLMVKKQKKVAATQGKNTQQRGPDHQKVAFDL